MANNNIFELCGIEKGVSKKGNEYIRVYFISGDVPDVGKRTVSAFLPRSVDVNTLDIGGLYQLVMYQGNLVYIAEV